MAYGKLKADTLVYDNGGSDAEVALSTIGSKANVDGQTFTGNVVLPSATTATTQSDGDNSTKLATTAYADRKVGSASPAFTGTATGVNLTLSGDLTVNGTTTTIDTTNLDVEDKNITLGKVTTPSDTTADGGGITLKGGSSDKTITWVNSTDTWDFNQGIKVTGTGTFTNSLTSGTDWNSGDGVTAESGGNLYIRNDSESGTVFAIQNGGNGTGGHRTAFITGDGAATFKGNLTTNAKMSVNEGGDIGDSANALEVWDDAATTRTFIVTGGGAVTSTSTLSDSKGNVRSIPQNTQAGAYTLVAADAGKHIFASGNINTGADSVFSAGDAVTIVNNTAGDLTITRGITTMYNAAGGDTNSATYTLAARGMVTILFVAGNEARISGGGLS